MLLPTMQQQVVCHQAHRRGPEWLRAKVSEKQYILVQVTAFVDS